MNKSDLLDEIRSARAEWEALLTQVDKDRLTQPGVEGDWSVRDIIAHVAAYEKWTAEQIAGAHLPDAAELEQMGQEGWNDLDRRNTMMHEQTRDLPLEEVLAQSEQAYLQLLSAVESLPEESLGQSQWWTGDDPLWKAIPAQCSEHYQQHAPSVLAWLERTT